MELEQTKSVIVLGAGMVGSAMALDISGRFQVGIADISAAALERMRLLDSRLQLHQADLRSESVLKELIRGYDIVLSAVPGFMGYQTLKYILEEGKNCVDISFFPENALELNALAQSRNVTAIVDCGVAPGMDNIILGYYDRKMKLDRFECLVGGLPKKRTWPFAYKAPFSPVDVVEEYVRPARYVENGKIVTREALTDPELVEFEEVGTLESFNTDGLRSIIFTMPHIPNMKEKTLRYPGHIEYIRVLRESGLFSDTPIQVNGQEVIPREVTSAVLFDDWKLGEDEPEFTVMRVTVEGLDDSGRKRVVYSLYDEYDADTRTSSMARTTGYTATAAVNLLDEGIFTEKGVFPPELVGQHEECFHYFLHYLNERGVHYRKEEIALSKPETDQ